MRLSPFRLAILNIGGNRFRSMVIALTASLVAGLAILATLVLNGAQENLQLNLQRLGADIVVMPWGVMIEETDSAARLMAFQSKRWMPQAYLSKIAAVQGVESVSPQLFIDTIRESAGDPNEFYFIAFDPQSDFTLRPWLHSQSGRALGMYEAIAGSSIPREPAERVLYGKTVKIVDWMESTGTDLDRSVFVTFETAYALNGLTHNTHTGRGRPLDLAPDSTSAAMVKVRAGSEPHDVAVRILSEVSGVIPIEATNFFQTERKQMVGLMQSLVGLLALTILLSTLFAGLVFSLAVNERRREIAVLLALGATQRYIFRSLLVEGLLLALVGGFSGILLISILVSLFHGSLSQLAEIPIHQPALIEWAALWIGGLLLSLACVSVAVLFPASRITRQEIALVMRE